MFGIAGIPTLILFRNGKPIERIVGFSAKAPPPGTLAAAPAWGSR
jgi:hypothetical protein